MSGSASKPPLLRVDGRLVDLSVALLMGIVNATPDSFSDGGRYPTVDARVQLAATLMADGARVIDVGGQSGITGVPEVEAAEEIDRVLPVVEGVRALDPDVLISVDADSPPVAEAAIRAGASIVNDVSGLLHPDVAGICADAGAALVIMHNRSKPKVRLTDPLLYDDVTADVVGFLTDKLAVAEAHGMDAEHVIFDPGIDFAKTPAQSITVLRDAERLDELGRPVLFALSRKDFIGALTQRSPRKRLGGTLATIAHLGGRPGHIYRVHDLAESADLLTVLRALDGRDAVADDLTLAVELRREPTPS
jgi:dihydropteroate synthase